MLHIQDFKFECKTQRKNNKQRISAPHKKRFWLTFESNMIYLVKNSYYCFVYFYLANNFRYQLLRTMIDRIIYFDMWRPIEVRYFFGFDHQVVCMHVYVYDLLWMHDRFTNNIIFLWYHLFSSYNENHPSIQSRVSEYVLITISTYF